MVLPIHSCGSGIYITRKVIIFCPYLLSHPSLNQITTIILNIKASVVDPHWLQCGSGSSFLSECGSVYGSESRKPNECGSRRIRILVRLLSYKKLNFYMKNIVKVDYRSKKHTYEGTIVF
jgi:hypothetical protein